jgi:hypothetical protein
MSPSKYNLARSAIKNLFTQPQEYWDCVKNIFMVLRAEFKFKTDVFFMILLRKIMKNTSVLKEHSAAEGGKNLFSQPHPNIIWREVP